MGSAISGPADEAEGCSVSPSRTCLGDLPESCITSILKFLDPQDICRFACLNRAYRDASSADIVWESKLPPNYHFLVERVLGEDPRCMGKKEIFSRLCRPNCFEGGTKEALLDKTTGSICVAVSSKALKITGIDDRRYWNRIPSEESRFSTVAYLQQMWWVEVVGDFEFQLLPGTYSLHFRLQLGKTVKRFRRRTCDLNQVHGWDIKPVRFQLSTSNGQCIVSECYLGRPGDWVQYHVGDFVVEKQDTPIGIKFSMVQIDCTHTKGGLSVDCVLICPCNPQHA